MNLQTVRAVCQILDVQEYVIRKAIREKRIPCLRLGSHILVDLDMVRDLLSEMTSKATFAEVCTATGLKPSAVRRGVEEGWIPCEKPGKSYVFDLDAVKAAIRQKMDEE